MKSQMSGVAGLVLGNRVNFLTERQQFTNLAPLEPAANLGYVWRRVFSRRAAKA